MIRLTLAAYDWLWPLARCPGHRRHSCFACDWPARDVVELVAAAHGGRRVYTSW